MYTCNTVMYMYVRVLYDKYTVCTVYVWK